jgi:hypothetical protein
MKMENPIVRPMNKPPKDIWEFIRENDLVTLYIATIITIAGIIWLVEKI